MCMHVIYMHVVREYAYTRQVHATREYCILCVNMRMRLETCEYVHVNMCVLMYVVCVDEYAV